MKVIGIAVAFGLAVCSSVAAQTPAEQQERNRKWTDQNTVVAAMGRYITAKRCAAADLGVNPNDLPALAEAIKRVTTATSLSQAERDSIWQRLQNAPPLKTPLPELCRATIDIIIDVYPGALTPTGEPNPF